jgi:hypothetical protein
VKARVKGRVQKLPLRLCSTDPTPLRVGKFKFLPSLLEALVQLPHLVWQLQIRHINNSKYFIFAPFGGVARQLTLLARRHGK